MNNAQLRGWLVLIVLFVAFFTYTNRNYAPAHSIYNKGEFGTSHLYASLKQNYPDTSISRLLISPFGLKELKNIDLMIIIGSERSYSSAEINAYRDFVKKGGSLIIFEDFGQARSIAASMGITFFDGVIRERSSDLYINRPTQFLLANYFLYILGIGSVDYLVANEAAGILDVAGILKGTTIPFLASSKFSYLDVDNDNNVDSGDTQIKGGIPMGLFKQYGDGYLMVISDASVPLNLHYNVQLRTAAGENFRDKNIEYSALFIATLGYFSNSTSIVFDESHQQIDMTSTSGLLNLIASNWVEIFNSPELISGLFVIIVVFALYLNKDVYGGVVSKFRQVKSSNVTANEFVSNPTLAEKGLTEQFLLYKRMGNEFIHIANIELYNKIQSFNRSDKFLAQFEKEYGKIDDKRSVKVLFEMHAKMSKHLNEELIKWL